MDVNAAWDLAAHDIAIANDWLGAIPLQAAAQGGSWINAGIEDAVFANLWYPDGVMVNLHVSWLSPRKVRDITIVGEKGMLTFDDMNLSEPLRLYDKQVTEQRTHRLHRHLRLVPHQHPRRATSRSPRSPPASRSRPSAITSSNASRPASRRSPTAGAAPRAVRVLDALSTVRCANGGRKETV